MSFESRVKTLLRWLDADGFFLSPDLDVRDSPTSGRGLYANAAVQRASRLVRIPPSYLLNFSTAVAHITKSNPRVSLGPQYAHLHVPRPQKDPVGDFYATLSLEKLLQLSSFQIISMFLVLERTRTNSFWKPFIDMLPQLDELLLSPLVWKNRVNASEKLWAMLPRSARKHSESIQARFDKDYEVVHGLLQASPKKLDLDKDAFLWAWMCINSRCLYMEVPQAKDPADNFTMAPYVDFLNHSPDDQCGIKVDTFGFHVFTSTAYAEGDELYFSYGPHSNEFLLCEYGFTLPDNKWNYIDISEYISVLLSPKQSQYLKTKGYWGEYTVNKDAQSFRTEVALATLQEPDPESSRRLNLFLDGTTDGSFYEASSRKLLTRILAKLEADCVSKLDNKQTFDSASNRVYESILGLYSCTRDICVAYRSQSDSEKAMQE